MESNDMDRVVPLSQLDDFRVAEGDPDVRGWVVRGSDGRKIGEVDELLVDLGAMKVRYLDVDLDVDDVILSGGQDRHVLIPIGYARLERDRDCVMVDMLTALDVDRLPAYDQGPLTRDFEASVRESFAAGGRSGGGVTSGGGMDTVGLDNTPGFGTGMAAGMAGGPLAGAPVPTRASGPELDAGRSGSMNAETVGGPGLGSGHGDRMGAGAQGPAGGAEREPVRGDASHQAGLAGSDYQHNADEDFYAGDAFDDARFYGARRGGTGSLDEAGGMRGSPTEAVRGDLGAGAGPGGVIGTGDAGVAPDETRRLAEDATERLREDHQNRDVGGSGGM